MRIKRKIVGLKYKGSHADLKIQAMTIKPALHSPPSNLLPRLPKPRPHGLPYSAIRLDNDTAEQFAVTLGLCQLKLRLLSANLIAPIFKIEDP